MLARDAQPVSFGRVERDTWLQRFVGKPTFRILPTTRGALHRLAEDVTADGPAFIYGRCDEKDRDLIAAYQRAGFYQVERHVSFCHGGGSRRDAHVGELTLRDALTNDRSAVVEIARSSFRFSRFHADPKIADEVADSIKAAWADNYFNGARGDGMIVAQSGVDICGFLLYLRAGADLVIDLVAVLPSWQGRGVGQALVGVCLARAGEGGSIRVGTQDSNTPSMMLYERLGFERRGVQTTLHCHVSGGRTL